MVGGPHPRQPSCRPDTTGFSDAVFGDPITPTTSFTMRALPTILDDGFGGYRRPRSCSGTTSTTAAA